MIECQLDHTAAIVAHAIGRASRADAVQGIDLALDKTPTRHRHFRAFLKPLEHARLGSNDVTQAADVFHQGRGIERTLGGGGIKDIRLFTEAAPPDCGQSPGSFLLGGECERGVICGLRHGHHAQRCEGFHTQRSGVVHKQPSEIRAVLTETGPAVMKRRLAGLNTSTPCVDYFHADHNIGGAAVTRRAHKQRPVR